MTDKPIGRGTVLAGRFRLEDLVQDTDGARLWRAIDQTLARSVAVNVIDTADPRSDALLSAARTSATITEGHFLRVLDAAQEDGLVYVVHEWGNGMSLDKMLAEGPLAPRRAAWLVKEVADAVAFAHGHGIAHGRLVPENVMVSEAGSVKLIGFVVDSVLHGRRQPATVDGRVLSDHESDVYNLAGLLYATLVAKWPGSHDSTLPGAPLEHERTLRPRQVRAGIPRPLDTICDRVLNPTAATGTLETAHEVSAALSDFIGDVAVAAGHEPTLAIERDEHARFRSAPDHTAPVNRPAPDPEATQASPPVFDDDQPPRPGPAPPPPLPEPAPRPLFAPGPPRGDSAQNRSHEYDPAADDPPRVAAQPGPGTGSLPPAWGPDAPADGEDEPAWDMEDSSRDWLKLAAAIGVVVLLVVAIVFAFNLGRGSPPDPRSEASKEATPTAAAPKPLQIADVTDLDPPPDGNGEENAELAALAVDGDPSTAWRTMQYYDPLHLLKDGVGLLVDLGRPQQVSSVRVTVRGGPTGFSVLAAAEGSEEPTEVEGLRRVATADSAGGRTDLDLQDPVTTRYLVVWLTSLPTDGGNYRGRIAEIAVSG